MRTVSALCRSRGITGSGSSGGSTKKWVPPAGGWQDTLPPEPQAPPAHRTARQMPSELDQLHALNDSRSSRNPASRSAVATTSSRCGALSSESERTSFHNSLLSFASADSVHRRSPVVGRPSRSHTGGNRLCKFPDTVVPGFYNGPNDPQVCDAEYDKRMPFSVFCRSHTADYEIAES